MSYPLAPEISADAETRQAQIDAARLERKRRRARERKAWGMRAAIRDKAADGLCEGVPELAHQPHNGHACNRDHIIPRCLGGADSYQNLRSVCLAIHDELNEALIEHIGLDFGEVPREGRDALLAQWMNWQAMFDVKGALT